MISRKLEKYFQDRPAHSVSDYGLISRSEKFLHERSVCHASMKYWRPEVIKYYDIFFTRVRPEFWEWTELCLDQTSGFRPFLESFCYLDIDFIKRTGIFLFPDIKYGLPMEPLFSFCVLVRQPWDTQENSSSASFMSRVGFVKQYAETAAETVFCTLCFSRVNQSDIVVSRHGLGHGVFCGPPERYVLRWFSQTPDYSETFFDPLFGPTLSELDTWGISISDRVWRSKMCPHLRERQPLRNLLSEIRTFMRPK